MCVCRRSSGASMEMEMELEMELIGDWWEGGGGLEVKQ